MVVRNQTLKCSLGDRRNPYELHKRPKARGSGRDAQQNSCGACIRPFEYLDLVPPYRHNMRVIEQYIAE